MMTGMTGLMRSALADIAEGLSVAEAASKWALSTSGIYRQLPAAMKRPMAMRPAGRAAIAAANARRDDALRQHHRVQMSRAAAKKALKAAGVALWKVNVDLVVAEGRGRAGQAVERLKREGRLQP